MYCILCAVSTGAEWINDAFLRMLCYMMYSMPADINRFMNLGYIISQLRKYTQAHFLLINTMPIFYLLKPSELAHRHLCLYIAHLIIQMHTQRFGILFITPHSLSALQGM